jgi:hypothetical protein
MAKKQKNIKKQTKTNKGKFGLRKLDFKKNWKKLSYLGLAGFFNFDECWICRVELF